MPMHVKRTHGHARACKYMPPPRTCMPMHAKHTHCIHKHHMYANPTQKHADTCQMYARAGNFMQMHAKPTHMHADACQTYARACTRMRMHANPAPTHADACQTYPRACTCMQMHANPTLMRAGVGRARATHQCRRATDGLERQLAPPGFECCERELLGRSWRQASARDPGYSMGSGIQHGIPGASVRYLISIFAFSAPDRATVRRTRFALNFT